MEKFAQLHETEKGQILVTKEYDDHNDDYLLTIWFPVGNALGKAEVKITSEENANKVLEEYSDIEKLKSTINAIIPKNYQL